MERYRTLINHLPIPLWQVDAVAMSTIFDDLRAEGVTDICAYLDANPALVDCANRSVRVTEVNLEGMRLFGGDDPARFIQPVGYLFAASPLSARRVMTAH